LLAQHAQLVAVKLYQGLVPFIETVTGIGRDTKARDLARLRGAIGGVRDAQTLSDFMQLHGTIAEKYEPALKAELDRLRRQQSASEWRYMGLYILGGLLLFMAGWIDWRLAETPASKAPAGKPQAKQQKR
jgi:hypothetical protein